MDIKPIETVYRGYKFRSRTEARWGVFFDALRIRWDYEKEGYILPDGTWYLPDFWLKDHKFHAEVKGDCFTVSEMIKCNMLVTGTGYPCIMLAGVPSTKKYQVLYRDLCLKDGEFIPGTDLFEMIPDFKNYDRYSDDYLVALSMSRQARFEYADRKYFSS